LAIQLSPIDSESVKEDIRKNFGARTFKESKALPMHRWYPYVEGFSASWLQNKLLSFTKENIKIYDPFAGCGTTLVEASKLNKLSYYSEINPFMEFITETKVNDVMNAQQNLTESVSFINGFIDIISSRDFLDSKSFECNLENPLLQNDYFEENHLNYLLKTKKVINAFDCPHYIKSLLLLAIASIAVNCSNMTRRADLRRRRSDEYKDRIVNVPNALIKKLNEIIDDLSVKPYNQKPTIKVTNDAKVINEDYINSFDFAITSPPYLNGTNYIRNTQIELWLLEIIKSKSEIDFLRKKTVCAGINDVVESRYSEIREISSVEEVASILDKKAYDKRIPIMIRSYFSDMLRVIQNVFLMLKEEGIFIMDIGDSKFCGVHIPTDIIIADLAKDVGFEIIENDIIASRYSRDKTALKQVQFKLLKRK
jgi:DNA modification methylase